MIKLPCLVHRWQYVHKTTMHLDTASTTRKPVFRHCKACRKHEDLRFPKPLSAFTVLWRIIRVRITGGDDVFEFIKCDRGGCPHMEIHDALTAELVGKPCPRCNANLLRQKDFALWLISRRP